MTTATQPTGQRRRATLTPEHAMRAQRDTASCQALAAELGISRSAVSKLRNPHIYGPTYAPPGAVDEGSPEAIEILLLLHRHAPDALSMLDIEARLPFAAPALRAAIAGLEDRGRIHRSGRGRSCRYAMPSHAKC